MFAPDQTPHDSLWFQSASPYARRMLAERTEITELCQDAYRVIAPRGLIARLDNLRTLAVISAAQPHDREMPAPP